MQTGIIPEFVCGVYVIILCLPSQDIVNDLAIFPTFKIYKGFIILSFAAKETKANDNERWH